MTPLVTKREVGAFSSLNRHPDIFGSYHVIKSHFSYTFVQLDVSRGTSAVASIAGGRAATRFKPNIYRVLGLQNRYPTSS